MRDRDRRIAPLSTDVYIHSASCTKITNKPDRGFFDLCLEAGRKALQDIDPLEIDSFYVASMDPGFGGVTGELTASLAVELGMMPRETLGIRGTSSAGGTGCIPCFKDIASGLHRCSLLISGEQMNPVQDGAPPDPEKRAMERQRVQRFLAGVVDKEDRAYGLSMVSIGDLYESALNRYMGLSHGDARQTIRRSTLEMYRRSASYPFAQFAENQCTADQYEASPWISPFYRRDDVVPISSGACAVVFSSTPPQNLPHGRIVRLRGVGQGIQHPALTRRFGPVTLSPSIRRAVFTLARHAGLTREDLRQADVGFPHDAFPSITRMILKELGYMHAESIDGLCQGRFNPLGGLVKCGHPVGCSGELQLVRAFQILAGDPAISDELRPPRADTAFTVSVGAALTNIVAFYLEAGDATMEWPEHAVPDESYYEFLHARLIDDEIYWRFEQAMAQLPSSSGVVLARTRTDLGWVHLLQCRANKRLALSDDQAPIGALVAVRGDGELNSVTKILDEQLETSMLRDFGVTPAAGDDPHRTSLVDPLSQARQFV